MKCSLMIDCPQKWTSMSGDDQIRHCGMCDQNIHNLEEFGEEEARAIIAEGTNCVRMNVNGQGQIKTISGFSKSLLFMGLAMGCGDSSDRKVEPIHENQSQVEKPIENVRNDTKDKGVLNEEENTNSNDSEGEKGLERPHFVGKVAPKKDIKKESPKKKESNDGE